jgi:hypothetical protein
MIYVVCPVLIWAVISVLFFMKVFSSKQERQELSAEGLMGVAHDVFQIEKEVGIASILTGENVLSEDDFEVEYDSLEMSSDSMFDDNSEDSTTQEGSIIGFKEMQQMVAVVEGDALPDNKNLENAKRTIKQIKDTDFFEKMIKTKEDISRRIDDILNNINA